MVTKHLSLMLPKKTIFSDFPKLLLLGRKSSSKYRIHSFVWMLRMLLKPNATSNALFFPHYLFIYLLEDRVRMLLLVALEVITTTVKY